MLSYSYLASKKLIFIDENMNKLFNVDKLVHSPNLLDFNSYNTKGLNLYSMKDVIYMIDNIVVSNNCYSLDVSTLKVDEINKVYKIYRDFETETNNIPNSKNLEYLQKDDLITKKYKITMDKFSNKTLVVNMTVTYENNYMTRIRIQTLLKTVVMFYYLHINDISYDVIDIYLVLSPYDRIFNSKKCITKTILNELHIESGALTSSARYYPEDNKIVIFRLEENHHTLIHELYHSTGLDKVNINFDNVANRFNLTNNHLSSRESITAYNSFLIHVYLFSINYTVQKYTEDPSQLDYDRNLADSINCTYDEIRKKKVMSLFHALYRYVFYLEYLFAIIQASNFRRVFCNKILNYNPIVEYVFCRLHLLYNLLNNYDRDRDSMNEVMELINCVDINEWKYKFSFSYILLDYNMDI